MTSDKTTLGANVPPVFNLSHVFHTLYRPLLLQGIQKFASSQQLASGLICADIETQLVDLFAQMDNLHISASCVRVESLYRLSTYLTQLRTFRTCLYCNMRKPEHVMGCGHTICDTCVAIFGKPVKGLEYRFSLTTCLLCKANVDFSARILPPTCGIRFISIDGGGSRGIVSIEYLDALQDTLGLNYPIQEHFDFSIGTSSGQLLPNHSLF
jgi:hypothetical protein